MAAMTEFELIARFFTRPIAPGGAVACGIGDDCALLDFGGPEQVAVTTDMLLAGRHFFPDAAPADVGHKALAVNLSDLAAAGAQPQCFFLSIALARADEAWLQAFSTSMLALAERFGCPLAGGDTTRVPCSDSSDGPLTISITAMGTVPRGGALTRGGARAGDDVWISGRLGDAALAVEFRNGRAQVGESDRSEVCARLDRPQPRVALGLRLRGIATACIDVSDGLTGDLGHILERSQVGARVEWAMIPCSEALRRQPVETQLRCALAGGDDYELLFTAGAEHRAAVERAALEARTPVTRVGAITDGRDLLVVDRDGRPMDMPFKAYDHFGSYDPSP
jgi:thiamine-monophosphate kinase